MKLQVSSSRPGALKDAHSCLLFWGTLGRLPAVGSFCLGAAPAQGEDLRRASRALPASVDQGCLLLSTPSSTPITRARPPPCPIGSLGKSTFPRCPGGDWLGQLSVKRASRKDAARVLGTRSPERRRGNLLYKQDVGPPSKAGGGGAKAQPSPRAPPEPSGLSAESGNPSLPPLSASRPPLQL